MFEDLDYAINILKEYVTETGGMKPLEDMTLYLMVIIVNGYVLLTP